MYAALLQTSLAAFCAILAHLSSMGGSAMNLAGRVAMMRGGAKWVNPYVADGLVAMWDGEWNVGGGKHDTSATTWKDLAGNHDLSITELTPVVSWNPDSIDYHRTSKTDGNPEYYFYSDDNIFQSLAQTIQMKS